MMSKSYRLVGTAGLLMVFAAAILLQGCGSSKAIAKDAVTEPVTTQKQTGNLDDALIDLTTQIVSGMDETGKKKVGGN